MATRSSLRRSILVTGGFGFLGSHLVERLAGEGDADILVVDNLSTSTLDVPRFCADCHRRWPGSRVTFTIDTIQAFEAHARSARTQSLGSFQEVYHVASLVGPVGVLPHAGAIVGQVIRDAYAVMDLSWGTDQATLIDVSTSEIYGGGRDGACAESDPRIVPAGATARLEYAVAKLAAETALLNAGVARKRRIVVVRPFNIAGPRQSPIGGFVLPRFARQAVTGAPITVYGDGSAVRAFTHVVDVADGLVLAARRSASGGVYNLGRLTNRTTILDLAHQVRLAAGSSSPIVHVDPRDLHGPGFAEAFDKYPDSDLATRQLGWVPTRGLAEIIADAVDDARARLASEAGAQEATDQDGRDGQNGRGDP